ncbi:MAG: hypothetical protein GXO23_03030 [Crenarchaeota archaeon]|nr:hypothetical protein [Thermoproteota archaeon]
MRKITEVLVYDANDDVSFEEFLVMVLERLKAARYCRRIRIEIVRENDGLEMKAILGTGSNHTARSGEEEER